MYQRVQSDKANRAPVVPANIIDRGVLPLNMGTSRKERMGK